MVATRCQQSHNIKILGCLESVIRWYFTHPNSRILHTTVFIYLYILIGVTSTRCHLALHVLPRCCLKLSSFWSRTAPLEDTLRRHGNAWSRIPPKHDGIHVLYICCENIWVVHFTWPVFPDFVVDHFVVRTPHVRGPHRHSWARAEYHFSFSFYLNISEPRENKQDTWFQELQDAISFERRNSYDFCQDTSGSDQAPW